MATDVFTKMEATRKSRLFNASQKIKFQAADIKFWLEQNHVASPAELKFLEKNKVDEIINKAFIQVLIHKPTNPFEFLANHFEWENSKSNPLKKSCQLLSGVDHKSQSFELSVQQAYTALSHCKVRENLKCLTGDVYMDFMQMLCNGLDEAAEVRLLENVYIPPTEVVSFRAFRAGVFCCSIYKDFLAKIKVLYSKLDTTGSGLTVKLVKTVLLEVSQQTSQEASSEEARQQHSAHPVTLNIKSLVLSDCLPPETVITKEQFEVMASDIFWSKIMNQCFSEN